MAKNLKLNIKNTQLAEALNLKLKKGKEKEKEETPAPSIVPPAEEKPSIPVIEEPSLSAPVVEQETPPPPLVVEKQEEPPARWEPEPRTNPAPQRSAPPRPFPPRRPQSSFQNNAPGAPRRESPGGYRPPGARPSSFPRDNNQPRPEGSRFHSFPRDNNQPRPEGTRFSSFPRDSSQPRPVRREDSLRRPPIVPREPVLKATPQQHQVHKKAAVPPPEKETKVFKKMPNGSSFDSRARQGLRDEGEEEAWKRRKHFKSKALQVEEVIRPKELKVRLPITIKDLASEMKLKATELIAKLFMQGITITLNDFLDDETTIQLLGHEFDCEISVDTSEEKRIKITDKTIKQEIQETDPALLQLRAPIVTFMGHVDHGKTSLIDAIRKANVASGEAGAITQHIGAFTSHTPIGTITILDTPGHEAFSAMRERGAEVTDIVVLVVAGDEGIRAQTIEAINQARQANVCLIVAINKSDKPNFQADTVYRQLADHDLLPEAWGGAVITVNCSAATGQGIPELLEMLALQSEVLELKANPSARARGTVIESEMHKGLGPVATVLVQNGTLQIGDALVFGQLYARVKTMRDEQGMEVPKAGPSTPVKITGLSGVPSAGSEFIVVSSEKEAKEISSKRSEGLKQSLLQQAKRGSMENLLQSKIESGEKKVLNLILKADVQGSLEALKQSLKKLPSKKVLLNFILEGVGEVSESDIQYASTSKAVIIGFHTGIESHAEPLIKQTKTVVRTHNIIYHAVDDVKELMLGLLDKIPEERELGEAAVKTVFKSSQLGSIAGCQVTTGLIRRSAHARLIRDGQVIWKGSIASLKRVKEDVREVQKGIECGILLQGFQDVKEEDIIQAYEIIYLQQELT